MLSGLGHRTISSGDDQNSTVHLRSSRDHVLHVIGVPGAIDVTIMTVICFVFDVRGVDGNLSSLFFWRSIDVFVGHRFCTARFAQNLRDGLCECCFSVIDVTDRSDVDVGLAAIEFSGKTTTQRQTNKVAIVGELCWFSYGPRAEERCGRLHGCGCGSRKHYKISGRKTRMDLLPAAFSKVTRWKYLRCYRRCRGSIVLSRKESVGFVFQYSISLMVWAFNQSR
mmetsp:Transcript_11920/g.28261  ORF Transcript_11920/g.28261 Transcript_11920/m.28261 type:complete len:224 (-) Transcript_11920:53-724(-)